MPHVTQGYKMYTIKKDGKTIIRTADKAFIPIAPENIDYQEFIKWQNDGGVSKSELDDPVAVESAKVTGLQINLMPMLIDAVLALLDGDMDKIKASKDKINATVLSSGVVLGIADVSVEVLQGGSP
jgi:hypothetical protein